MVSRMAPAPQMISIFLMASEHSIFNGASDRHSVLGAIQWKPVENFEVNIDAFFSTFDQTNTAAGLRLAGGLGSRRQQVGGRGNGRF